MVRNVVKNEMVTSDVRNKVRHVVVQNEVKNEVKKWLGQRSKFNIYTCPKHPSQYITSLVGQHTYLPQDLP
mgnify:CR=1 FL=1